MFMLVFKVNVMFKSVILNFFKLGSIADDDGHNDKVHGY